MAANEDRSTRDAGAPESARKLWDELALKARAIHCPEHFVAPWRVVVIGDTPRLRLQVYGCCERIGQAVTAMVNADPRVASQAIVDPGFPGSGASGRG